MTVTAADATLSGSQSFTWTVSSAQSPLGSAQNFAVLGASTVTSTGATVITGDLGVSPGIAITGFRPPPANVIVGDPAGTVTDGPGLVSGTIRPGGPVASLAHADAAIAYATFAGLACPAINNLTGQILGIAVLTLGPGVYCFDTSAQLTGTLNLTGAGPWIFQIGTTLTTAAGSSIVVVDAGPTCSGSNVFWNIGTSATIGASTTFAGNILAAVSVTVGTGVSVSGSVLALTGAVTMDTNNVSVCSTNVNRMAAPANRAPVLTQPATQTSAVNATIALPLAASDPDGTALTYSAIGLPATLTVDAGTGLISGTLTSTSAGTYTVTATVSDGALTNSKTFTWTVTAVTTGPSLTSLSPTSGAAGTMVTITGANFGSPQGSSSVFFNGTNAAPTNWSATSIVVPVPTGTTTGSVVVTVGGVASNGVTFTVGGGTSAITLIQLRKLSTSGASAAQAFASNNTAGNFIAVAVRASLADQIFIVTDSLGNLYRPAVAVNNGADDTLAIYYAENIRAGANTVTVAASTSATSLRFAIFEYAGIATANSLDVTASAQSSTATASPTSGNATTTASGDLLIGAISTRGTRTDTAGSGYTIRAALAPAPSTVLMVEDAIQATAGPAAATATLSSANGWGAALAAFRSASAAAAASAQAMTSLVSSSAVQAPATTQLASRPPAPRRDDFDGDGSADMTVIRPATSRWYADVEHQLHWADQFFLGQCHRHSCAW